MNKELLKHSYKAARTRENDIAILKKTNGQLLQDMKNISFEKDSSDEKWQKIEKENEDLKKRVTVMEKIVDRIRNENEVLKNSAKIAPLKKKDKKSFQHKSIQTESGKPTPKVKQPGEEVSSWPRGFTLGGFGTGDLQSRSILNRF